MFKRVFLTGILLLLSSFVYAGELTVAPMSHGLTIEMQKWTPEFEPANPGTTARWATLEEGTLEEGTLEQLVTTDIFIEDLQPPDPTLTTGTVLLERDDPLNPIKEPESYIPEDDYPNHVCSRGPRLPKWCEYATIGSGFSLWLDELYERYGLYGDTSPSDLAEAVGIAKNEIEPRVAVSGFVVSEPESYLLSYDPVSYILPHDPIVCSGRNPPWTCQCFNGNGGDLPEFCKYAAISRGFTLSPEGRLYGGTSRSGLDEIAPRWVVFPGLVAPEPEPEFYFAVSPIFCRQLLVMDPPPPGAWKACLKAGYLPGGDVVRGPDQPGSCHSLRELHRAAGAVLGDDHCVRVTAFFNRDRVTEFFNRDRVAPLGIADISTGWHFESLGDYFNFTEPFNKELTVFDFQK